MPLDVKKVGEGDALMRMKKKAWKWDCRPRRPMSPGNQMLLAFEKYTAK